MFSSTDLLGTRLERDGDSLLQTQACLCYICAGNVEKLIACWTKAQDGSSPLSLQVSIFETKGASSLVLSFTPAYVLETDLFQVFTAFTLLNYTLVLWLDNYVDLLLYLEGQRLR